MPGLRKLIPGKDALGQLSETLRQCGSLICRDRWGFKIELQHKILL